ncbi:MAG: CotH kinase family protein [Bacteroidales bacterium]|nr:CotH kinase family protein [Bacteroidales bacterium]
MNVPHDELKIINGNILDEPVVSRDRGSEKWLINLVDTGLSFEKVKDDKSYPLCLWYDVNLIKIYLCNGSVITRACNPRSVFKTFSFLVSDNKSLSADIHCSISDLEISGTRPQFYANLRLRPRFESRAVKVSVGGEPQTSGESVQDFSVPVVYDVELYDGSSVSYTVTLKCYGDFPSVYITTDGGRPVLDKVNYVPGTIRVDDPFNEHSATSSFQSRMKIRGRGNSTWSFFPKKPYRIKLDEKSEVLGIKSDKDWILLANYDDKALMRNAIAFELSRICGFSWTPTFYPVELYFNNAYMGVYEFGEHKEVSKNKVNINPDAGDVYLELECYPDEPYNFWTSMSIPLTYKDPEAPSKEFRREVEGFFQDFETALQSDYFTDPYRGYAAYIDIKSFVDNYIIQELTKNYDGNLHKSTFFSKKKEGKLEFCHVWDFDLSLGNCSFFGDIGGGNGPEGFYVKDYGFQGYGWGWYYRLFQDPAFRTKVKNRWNELKPQLETIPAFIDERAEYLNRVASNNFKRWNILGTNVWSQVVIPGSYAGEINYLKDFYNKRLKWLDQEINKW